MLLRKSTVHDARAAHRKKCGCFTREPYRKANFFILRRYGTGKKTGIQPFHGARRHLKFLRKQKLITKCRRHVHYRLWARITSQECVRNCHIYLHSRRQFLSTPHPIQPWTISNRPIGGNQSNKSYCPWQKVLLHPFSPCIYYGFGEPMYGSGFKPVGPEQWAWAAAWTVAWWAWYWRTLELFWRI